MNVNALNGYLWGKKMYDLDVYWAGNFAFKKIKLVSALCWMKYIVLISSNTSFLHCNFFLRRLSLPLPHFYLLLLHLFSLAIPLALSPSLYLDLFCFLSDIVPPHTRTHKHTNSLTLSLLSLHPLCWPPLARCHTFSHKWSSLWF